MTNRAAILWGAAILTIALLNIVDVLPDWTTITAVLTLPLVANWRCSGARCGAKEA